MGKKESVSDDAMKGESGPPQKQAQGAEAEEEQVSEKSQDEKSTSGEESDVELVKIGCGVSHSSCTPPSPEACLEVCSEAQPEVSAEPVLGHPNESKPKWRTAALRAWPSSSEEQ